MRRIVSSDKFVLFGYFILIILVGAILLSLPSAWNGQGRLSRLDALFTATSAVCVTGLITVDTASYSRFGQTVILFLIQFGGLGVITFTTIYLIIPGLRISLNKSRMIRAYYMGTVEQNPARIIRNILLFTICIETAGALFLYFRFSAAGTPASLFTAVFHSVSAFCNAGFSTFSDSLAGFAGNSFLLLIVMGLIVSGGLSFVVIQELAIGVWRRRYRITYHTKIVVTMTFLLLAGGCAMFYLFEAENLLAPLSGKDRLVNALFQSVTPRTAGFNVLDQGAMTLPSKVLAMFLMFVGGAPVSIAGGVKVTAFFIVLMYLFRHGDEYGDIVVDGRRLTKKTTTSAGLLVLKAVTLVGMSAFALSVTETLSRSAGAPSFLDLLFETVSAFGTVGLSLGATSHLSGAGKVVLILTMFAGRVGLIAMSLPIARSCREVSVYPEGTVLIA